MGMTTTLPASINLAAIGNAESGTGKYIANSGSTVFNFDGAVISVALTVYGNTMAISPGFDFGTYSSAIDIDNITITAVGNGSTTLEIVSGKPSATPTVSIPVTVGAVADDESYLNKRGLAHFWENIDTLKQDKLTAGNYSTSEQDTKFTWTNGAKIYKKTIVSTNLVAGENNINHGISNLGLVLKYDGFMDIGSGTTLPIPTIASATNNSVSVWTVNSTIVKIFSSLAFTGKVYITLYYTKTS